MSFFKTIFLFAALSASSCIHAQYTDQINSNRPGQSMGAFAVGKTIMQVETGLFGTYEKHSILNTQVYGGGVDLTLRYGAFLEELEFLVDFKYQFDHFDDAIYSYGRNDLKQLTIGAKYLIYDPDKNYNPEPNLYSWKANHKFKWRTMIPAVSAYLGYNFMNKNNPYTFPDDTGSPKVIVLTQNHFGPWVWVNNIIGDKLFTEYPSYGLVSTVTRTFNKKWSGMVEYQGFTSDYYADAIFRVGAARLLSDTMQLDATISSNFKSTPYVAYADIGFSWRFDAKYKDILLPGRGNRQDEYEAEQKKEKEDKKKKKEERKARKEEERNKQRIDQTDFETGK